MKLCLSTLVISVDPAEVVLSLIVAELSSYYFSKTQAISNASIVERILRWKYCVQ